jgi:hypothetical protein
MRRWRCRCAADGHLTIVGIAGGSLPVGFLSIAYEASVATAYWGTLPELLEVIALASAGHIKAQAPPSAWTTRSTPVTP